MDISDNSLAFASLIFQAIFTVGIFGSFYYFNKSRKIIAPIIGTTTSLIALYLFIASSYFFQNPETRVYPLQVIFLVSFVPFVAINLIGFLSGLILKNKMGTKALCVTGFIIGSALITIMFIN